MKSSLLSVGGQLSQGHWREGSAPHRSWIATRVFPMATCGIMEHDYQNKHNLQQDHRPRNVPRQQLGSKCHHGPSRSLCHPDQYSFWWQDGHCTSAWLQVADQTAGNCTIHSSNRSNGYQLRPWSETQIWPSAAAWPQIAGQATQITMALFVAWSSDTNMT